MTHFPKVGRNDPCPCGALKPDGKPVKYKHCHDENPRIPHEVLNEFFTRPQEPFEKGGFLTGRPFISTIFQGKRMRAMANRVYQRPIDETFHLFILRRFFDTLTQKWVEAEEKKEKPHTLIQWSREMQSNIDANQVAKDEVRGVKLTGNMRSLLAIAYDFYTLDHCGATVPSKVLDRLRDEEQFQGARYEIAVAGLVVRSGFNIEWLKGKDKHSEFMGTHKVTGAKAVFEAKSHHRDGVLGRAGTFDPDSARIKIMDHVKKALEQAPTPTNVAPLVIFDDLNLPLTAGKPSNESKWFKEVEQHLEKYGFLRDEKYKHCILFLTNFSWHFDYDVPPEKNEVVVYFFSSDFTMPEPLKYLDLAAKQYGFVPALEHEFADRIQPAAPPTAPAAK